MGRGGGGFDQREAGILSCDLRANERPQNKFDKKGTTDRQKDIYTLTLQLYERIGLRADSLKIIKYVKRRVFEPFRPTIKRFFFLFFCKL